MSMKNVIMAFFFAVLLSSGAVQESNLSFAEDYTVLSEAAVLDSELDDKADIYNILPSSSSAQRRANRRATDLHRQKLDKKRSRWSTLSLKDKLERVPQWVRNKINRLHIKELRKTVAKAQRQSRILQGGFTRVATMGVLGGLMVLIGLTDTNTLAVSAVGFGLLVGSVRDGSEYIEIRKGLVVTEDQIVAKTAADNNVEDIRNFKQAKFSKQVSLKMTALSAAKAQTMAAKAALVSAKAKLSSDDSDRPAGKTMVRLMKDLSECEVLEQDLIGEVNDLLDTSKAIEGMTQMNSESVKISNQLFVTNPDKMTCSFEIECKFPNDHGLTSSGLMESAAAHIKANYRAEGIQQGAYYGDYSETSQQSIVVSVDSSLHNEVQSYASHDEMSFDEQGYIFCVEIKTPVWTVERATKRIPILMNALKTFRISGGSCDNGNGDRGFIDVECGMHVHIGVCKYGYANMMRDFIREIERKIAIGDVLNADETMWVDWMNSIVCNYSVLQISIDTVIHASRRSGNCYYSNPVDNYAARIKRAYALQAIAETLKPEFAYNRKGEMDATVWKDMWLGFINAYMEHNQMYHCTNLMCAWEEWDGEEDIPQYVMQAYQSAMFGPANALCDMIASERGAGDGGSYPNVNMGALAKHGTVEYRQQGGLLNSDAMIAWLYFLHSVHALSMSGMRYEMEGGLSEEDAKLVLVDMAHSAVVRMSASTAKADALFKHLSLVDEGVLGPGWSEYVQNNNALDTSKGNKNRDFLAVAGGFGLSALFTKLSPLMLLLGAVCMVVGCGVGGLVKLKRNSHLSKREAFGLRKVLGPALGDRGRQSIGVAMFEDGRGRVRKAARPESEQSGSWQNRGYNRGWGYVESGSDMPAIAGPLLIEALVGSRDNRDYTADAWMVHTRYATNGAINERNAHPMRADNITIMHNGVVNDGPLREFLKEDGQLDEGTRLGADAKNNETDTFAIGAALNYAGSDNDGIELMSQMVDGSMRIMWVDEREKLADNLSPRIHLWSNTSDLWFGETVNGNIVWASEKDILLEAFGEYKSDRKGRGKTHGSCLIRGSVFPAQIGAHYVIDYDFGLINLGRCGSIKTYDSNAWRSGTTKKETTTTQSKSGEVMVTETKGGVTTIKPLSQIDACSSPAKDCGIPVDAESKWEEEVATDRGVFVWDEATQALIKQETPLMLKELTCPCGLQESACVENCPALTEHETENPDTLMDINNNIAVDVAFGDVDWDCIDCLAGDCVCSENETLIQQSIRKNTEQEMRENLENYIMENADVIEYEALDDDMKELYDDLMSSETRQG